MWNNLICFPPNSGQSSFRLVIVFLAFFVHGTSVFGFPTQDEDTIGYRALEFSRARKFWSSIDFTAIDGSVTTSPPDSIRYDRRIEAQVNVGADVPIAASLYVRPSLKAHWQIRKEEEKDPPRSPIEKSYSKLQPSVVMTFINTKGLEIFGGVMVDITSGYTETQKSVVASSETTFNSLSILVPRAGIVKRGATWNGGFYYGHGRESTRTFRKTASDQTETSGLDSVYVPTEYGIVVHLKLTMFDLDLDIAAVQAGGGGERSDSGITINDDYLRFRASGSYPLPGANIKFSIAHKTLSYSSNAFMSMDTIPVSSLQVLYQLGTADRNIYYGLIYGYAKDGQSIPEFNADYNFHAVGSILGLVFPI